jgi:Hsp70 protein
MTKMVNFGIDLGTTNSLIAKFDKGQVEVFKNPNGFRETLPSVVGFRNDRILVGDQARSYLERDPKNVASRFKRKMGTTETIKIQSSGSKTPVELSAFVLKELKNFVHSGEAVGAAVITIPASFDTVQSNATKEAGLAAGFNLGKSSPCCWRMANPNSSRNSWAYSTSASPEMLAPSLRGCLRINRVKSIDYGHVQACPTAVRFRFAGLSARC